MKKTVCLHSAVAALFLITVPTFAGSDGLIFVKRNGKQAPMSESTQEIGVALRREADPAACAARLGQTCGLITPFSNTESRYKIITLKDASRRREVRNDPDVERTFRVLRFDGDSDPVLATGEINVRLKSGLSGAAKAALWADMDVHEIQSADGLPDTFLIRLNSANHDEVTRAANLSSDSRVVWAQPNLIRWKRVRQVATTDGLFANQWHLNNTGQGGGLADADIDAPEAWILSEGQNVLIGMFDDACDIDHEDLRDNYSGTGHDPSLESTDPGFDDPSPKQIGDRHGTAVMGLAVARANATGVRGVAYLSTFTASRGLGSTSDFDTASAFTFARQQNVDVHLNSWGDAGPNSAIIEDAIESAIREGRPRDDMSLGMVVVFASGNEGEENLPGDDYSTIPQVIGIGASTDSDRVAAFSNFGENINILAPGVGEGQGIVTTDNEDRDGRVDNGYNVDGIETNGTEFGTNGSFTNTFGGTSAACPIAAGVAALVVSKNANLTTAQVRLIMEHACDPVSDFDAGYNKVTSRSARYGYGRINANRAVAAAAESLVNGGFAWPERPFNIRVSDGRLRWQGSFDTNEYLVVESDSPFEFIPRDSQCFDRTQAGCNSISLTNLPVGSRVLGIVDCPDSQCALGIDLSVDFTLSTARKHFGLFGRNVIGRYSFGVSADSDGNVTDSGPTVGDTGDTGGGGGSTGGSTDNGPSVSISVNPLEGESPLTVQFMGNAVSSSMIDEDRTEWDFDVDNDLEAVGRRRNTTNTYSVPDGQSRVFTAQLTMWDSQDRSGVARVLIRVNGRNADGSNSGGGESNIRIIVGVPGDADRDVDTGVSPFPVELSLDASNLVGTLQSISWDLGDGSRANSLIVPHTYLNDSDEDLVIPITVTVTSITSGSATVRTTATRFVTIAPGDPTAVPPTPPCNLPPCGEDIGPPTTGACMPLGMIPLSLGIASLSLMRRRKYWSVMQ